jgi:hypothetical protein
MKPRFPHRILPLVLALIACAPPHGRAERSALEQGRTYTTWLYGREYGKLWERLTPEMRHVFGSAAELGAFAGRAVTSLGREQGAVDERIAEIRPERVYSRTVSFTSAVSPMTIEWTLTPEGAVSGLAVRPADGRAAGE